MSELKWPCSCGRGNILAVASQRRGRALFTSATTHTSIYGIFLFQNKWETQDASDSGPIAWLQMADPNGWCHADSIHPSKQVNELVKPDVPLLYPNRSTIGGLYCVSTVLHWWILNTVSAQVQKVASRSARGGVQKFSAIFRLASVQRLRLRDLDGKTNPRLFWPKGFKPNSTNRREANQFAKQFRVSSLWDGQRKATSLNSSHSFEPTSPLPHSRRFLSRYVGSRHFKSTRIA